MVKSVKRSSGTTRSQQNPVAKRTGGPGGGAGEGGGFFSKVDPTHLTELVGSFTNVVKSNFELESERERTAQKRIDAAVSLQEIAEKARESERRHEHDMTRLRDEAIRSRDEHSTRIAEIEHDAKRDDKRDDERSRFIGMLERGEISAEECNALIATLHSDPTSGTGAR
jgi:hypothetical protein